MDSIYFPPSGGASDKVALTADKAVGHDVAVAWLKIGSGESSGLLRDEAQALVDFLIEALEEYDERQPKWQPEVGDICKIIDRKYGHYLMEGQIVVVDLIETPAEDSTPIRVTTGVDGAWVGVEELAPFDPKVAA